MPDRPQDPDEPGPFRNALFQLVPLTLDSLWRKSEFRANRIGRVGLQEPHELILRPAWASGAFGLFVLMSVFAVFGPTSDAICSIAGFGVATRTRAITSAILAIVAVVLTLAVLNLVMEHLTRRAEELADKACAENAQVREQREMFAQRLLKLQKYIDVARFFLNRPLEQILGNLGRFFAQLLFIRDANFWALMFALLILSLGAILVAAPIFAAAHAFRSGEVDALSCTQMAHGGPVLAQFAILLIVIVGAFFIWRSLGKMHAFLVCVASTSLLAVGIAVLWLGFTPAHPSEANGGFYPHVYLILIAALMLIAAAARPLAYWLLHSFAQFPQFRTALATEDLLNYSTRPPRVGNMRLLSAFINGVSTHLMQFLLLPALVVLVVPTEVMWPSLWIFTGVSVILLMYGSLSTQWGQMLVYVDRWFLVGSPLVLSAAVIGVAALRLKDVQYVSTVLDSTPIGVLFIFVVMMYVAFWLFEYWVNRWLSEELLVLLSDRKRACRGFLPCAFKPGAESKPWAEADGRYVAVHGTGRFVVQGWKQRDYPRKDYPAEEEAFTTYGLLELFEVLGSRVASGAEIARDIYRRVHLYFTFVNLALILAACGLFAWHLNWSRPLAVEPMVRASTIKPEQVSDAVQQAQVRLSGDPLATRLLAQSASARPSIVVAASGGGTRAAVYSAVALEGMGEIDRARDVVLLSGVSGGGVSAAIFASRFKDLREADPLVESVEKPGPWMRYVSAASQPFIQDVLEGSGELRIAGSFSLGTLLQESLQRRAFAPGMTDIQTFGQFADPGLILNTAISGHPYQDSELLKGRVAAPRDDDSCVQQSQPYANLAGGRLIFTNLVNVSGFPERSVSVPDMWLPYRIVNDGSVPLASASALTANFPPVFSNARVRLTTRKTGCGESYFVTDGGATENLGLVSALFALRGTLLQLAPDAKLTDIHVLALEASAIDYDYQDDRGIGAATGGSKERMNAGITQSLLKEVESLVTRHGAALHVHYLPLPVAFRSRGGFGTHWMFARNIRVSNPLLAAAPDWWSSWRSDRYKDHVDLDREEVMLTLRGLFNATDPICARAGRFQGNLQSAPVTWTADVQRVSRWICGHDDERGSRAVLPDYQVKAWAITMQDLADARQSAVFEPYSRDVVVR